MSSQKSSSANKYSANQIKEAPRTKPETNESLFSSSHTLNKDLNKKNLNRKIIPTILCGGSGSRLWPVSRELDPKPFIRLTDGQSLLQKAFLRSMHLEQAAEILTVTNHDLFFKTQDEYREVNTSNISTSFILEPAGRNTAAAIAAAALHISMVHGEECIMLILAADHLITDQARFADAVDQACDLARMGKLVTFGIQPTTPETGYGYIEADGNQVIQFIEKPSLSKAEEYLSSGSFYWNSGIFCFTAKTMISAMEEHCHEIIDATKKCIDLSRKTKKDNQIKIELCPKSFLNIKEDSIDYAVMEHSKHVAVVPCDIGWSDVGSWASLGDLTTPDENGNRLIGDMLLRNTENCTIQSKERLIGAVGVKDLIIIDTPDALLVANKSCTQNIKELYNELKTKGHDAHKHHRTVHRPWGTYTTLETGDSFKIKRIEVKPGSSLSLQMHQHRSEHWVVISGIAEVINGNQKIILNVNESTFIPAGQKHRLTNPGEQSCIIIEVQSGSYVGEDDIIRLEDNYGRA